MQQIVSLIKNASTKDQLTDLEWPASSATSIISICFDANLKLYRRKRRTGKGHGLSDEEKKNTSDEFELHIELGDSRKVAVSRS